MNNQARGCELKCKYNIQGICHAYGECIAKDLFIAELEKIRKEIMDKGMIPTHTYITVDGKALQKSVVDVVIDKHISELKGENKKECSTCKSDNSHENCLGCIEYGHWELKGENKCQNQTN